MGIGMLVPRFEQLLEKTLPKLARRSEVQNGGSGCDQTVAVSGTPRSYAVAETDDESAHVLEVIVSPGVEVSSFTFG